MKKRLYSGEKSGESKEAAARWMARKMSGAMSEKEKSEFETWLTASEVHAREFGELENLLTAADAGAETLLAGEFERELSRRDSLRARASWIGVAAAAIAGLVVIGIYFLRSF